MPTLKAFTSNKYRAIYVPDPHRVDLMGVLLEFPLLNSPICIDTRHESRRQAGTRVVSEDNRGC